MVEAQPTAIRPIAAPGTDARRLPIAALLIAAWPGQPGSRWLLRRLPGNLDAAAGAGQALAGVTMRAAGCNAATGTGRWQYVVAVRRAWAAPAALIGWTLLQAGEHGSVGSGARPRRRLAALAVIADCRLPARRRSSTVGRWPAAARAGAPTRLARCRRPPSSAGHSGPGPSWRASSHADLPRTRPRYCSLTSRGSTPSRRRYPAAGGSPAGPACWTPRRRPACWQRSAEVACWPSRSACWSSGWHRPGRVICDGPMGTARPCTLLHGRPAASDTGRLSHGPPLARNTLLAVTALAAGVLVGSRSHPLPDSAGARGVACSWVARRSQWHRPQPSGGTARHHRAGPGQPRLVRPGGCLARRLAPDRAASGGRQRARTGPVQLAVPRRAAGIRLRPQRVPAGACPTGPGRPALPVGLPAHPGPVAATVAPRRATGRVRFPTRGLGRRGRGGRRRRGLGSVRFHRTLSGHNADCSSAGRMCRAGSPAW